MAKLNSHKACRATMDIQIVSRYYMAMVETNTHLALILRNKSCEA